MERRAFLRVGLLRLAGSALAEAGPAGPYSHDRNWKQGFLCIEGSDQQPGVKL